MSKKIAIGIGAATLGLAMALPAMAQRDPSTLSMRGNVTDVTDTNWEGFYAGSAAAGSGTRASAMGTAADRNPSTEPITRHQGSNPANILCDSLQPMSLSRNDRLREQNAHEMCLASMSAGGGLQQASGDGD
jgi:hypothetical protein